MAKPVLVKVVHRDAETGLVAERAADRRAERVRVVAARGRLEVRREPLGRIRRADVDQPAERVRAVARALRAAQHLDAVDVVERADAAEPREVDVVDDEAERGVRRAVVLLELADAAQLEVARARALAREVQVRHLADRLLEVLDCRRAELLAVEHADARRELGDLCVAELGRDDDLVGRRWLRHRPLRERRRRGVGLSTLLRERGPRPRGRERSCEQCRDGPRTFEQSHLRISSTSETRFVLTSGGNRMVPSLRRY